MRQKLDYDWRLTKMNCQTTFGHVKDVTKEFRKDRNYKRGAPPRESKTAKVSALHRNIGASGQLVESG